MRTLRSSGTLIAIGALAWAGLAATGAVTVARGDSLSLLARRHGTTVAALAKANGISNPDRIYAGARLVLAGAAASPPAAAPATSAHGWVCPVAGARFGN